MFGAFVDLLFPAACGGCGRAGDGLCERCARATPPIEVILPTLRVSALGAYDGALRAAVLALKTGRRDVAAALGARLEPLVTPGALLVPVPTTRTRRRMRGFDGAVLLARVAAAGRAQVLEALAHGSDDTQRGRGRRERLAARDRFVCETGTLADTRLLLLDDVVTTGATLEDCAAALRRAGASVERALVVAAVRPDGSRGSERESRPACTE